MTSTVGLIDIGLYIAGPNVEEDEHCLKAWTCIKNHADISKEVSILIFHTDQGTIHAICVVGIPSRT
jgi:hypothetical protein